MKDILAITPELPRHWVGNGFPVRSLFAHSASDQPGNRRFPGRALRPAHRLRLEVRRVVGRPCAPRTAASLR
jgi:hypothetical protein